MKDNLPDILDLIIVASLDLKPKSVPSVFAEIVERNGPICTIENVYDRVHYMRNEYLIRVHPGGEPTKEECFYHPSANGRGMLRRWSMFLEMGIAEHKQAHPRHWSPL